MNTNVQHVPYVKAPELRVIKAAIGAFYDQQQIRIKLGQKITANLLSKLGLPPEPTPLSDDATDEQKKEFNRKKKERDKIMNAWSEKLNIPIPSDEEGEKKSKGKITDFFEIVTRDYKNLTDWVIANSENLRKPKKLTNEIINREGIGVISDTGEYHMFNAYVLAAEVEKELMIPIVDLVEKHPLWIKYLQHVKGIGHLMAGVILSTLDINHPKVKSASSFIQYAGWGTLEDPREFITVKGKKVPNPDYGKRVGTSKKDFHLVEKIYLNKDGEEVKTVGISFNPFLKSKMWLMATGFNRAGGHNYKVYRGYRDRLDQMEVHDGKSKPHKNNMALRYSAKMFLIDLYVAWCIIEGKTPRTPYHVEKLGMEFHSSQCPALKRLMDEYGYTGTYRIAA